MLLERPVRGWQTLGEPGPMGWRFTWSEWNRYARHWAGCAFCGGPQECIAALVAWRWGGGRNIGNAAPACFRCRKDKSTRLRTYWLQGQRRASLVLSMDTRSAAETLGLVDQLERHRRKLEHMFEVRRAAAITSRDGR